jgi:signal transduction histidine kinase
MRDADRRVIALVAVGRDLTERREFEAQLLQNEKLAALGVLAGGIAHELRNPLAVVSAAAQLLQDKSLPPDGAEDCVQRICHGVVRMAGIIEGLLSFARPPDKGRKTDLDLRPIITEALTAMANHGALTKYELLTKFPGEPVTVHGNACLLQQLVTNLVLNAVHSMAGRGGNVALTVDSTDTHALLFVADVGCGIPAAHLRKVFDPFFTTMPLGQGTGLGLSICHSIVQQHFGKIEIASQEDQGTTVKVMLPLGKERGDADAA